MSIREVLEKFKHAIHMAECLFERKAISKDEHNDRMDKAQTQALTEIEGIVVIKCSACKFWERCKTDSYHGGINLGECSCDKFFRGYGHTPQQIPKDGVLVEDDEGWGFYTAEEFGCIHAMLKERMR